VLGPLTNPAGARAQVVGVYAPALVPTLAEVLAQLGARRAFVVHGAGGIDELSPSGPNLVCEVVDGSVRRREIDPADFGVPRFRPSELRGGTPAENAATIRAILGGEHGAKREAVLLNAAGAIAAGGHAADLAEGYELATRAVDSGLAADRLEELVAFSRAEAAPADRGDAAGLASVKDALTEEAAS
jgi:anthranilate phosphoribosyltransferase